MRDIIDYEKMMMDDLTNPKKKFIVVKSRKSEEAELDFLLQMTMMFLAGSELKGGDRVVANKNGTVSKWNPNS